MNYPFTEYMRVKTADRISWLMKAVREGRLPRSAIQDFPASQWRANPTSNPGGGSFREFAADSLNSDMGRYGRASSGRIHALLPEGPAAVLRYPSDNARIPEGFKLLAAQTTPAPPPGRIVTKAKAKEDARRYW